MGEIYLVVTLQFEWNSKLIPAEEYTFCSFSKMSSWQLSVGTKKGSRFRAMIAKKRSSLASCSLCLYTEINAFFLGLILLSDSTYVEVNCFFSQSTLIIWGYF